MTGDEIRAKKKKRDEAEEKANPDSISIVAMVESKGVVYVATKTALYRMNEQGELEPVSIKYKVEDDQS